MSNREERLGKLLELISRVTTDAIRRGESSRVDVLDGRYFEVEDALYDLLMARERAIHYPPRVKRVHFVRASDPVGRMIIGSAARMWADDDDFSPADLNLDEYLRGQVETILECVRVIPEDEWVEYDDQRVIALGLMRASLHGEAAYAEALQKAGLS